MNKNKTEIFIQKAKKIHGDRYDYSLAQYLDSRIKLTIICKEHGEFQQNIYVHLKGNGCGKCGFISGNTKTTKKIDDVINNFKYIHGNTYNYSKVNYVNCKTPVIIGCNKHGDFKLKPSYHLNGIGCGKCKNKIVTTEDFINKSKIIHKEKYDYSLVNYINKSVKVIIICNEIDKTGNKHGEFNQYPSYHLNGSICPKCCRGYKKTTINFINESKIIHKNKYDYSLVKYTRTIDKVIIICNETDKYGKKHGEFYQMPFCHLKGSSCKKCNSKSYSKSSILYLEFMSKLKNIHIQHAENGGEYKIPNTKFRGDGYCKETNTIYEFHGSVFHGEPRIYNENDYNFLGKKYGDLYQKTLEREQQIRYLGYDLVVMWEYDWDKMNKYIKILQIKFRLNNLKKSIKY
jgi:hypothetical protein